MNFKPIDPKINLTLKNVNKCNWSGEYFDEVKCVDGVIELYDYIFIIIGGETAFYNNGKEACAYITFKMFDTEETESVYDLDDSTPETIVRALAKWVANNI